LFELIVPILISADHGSPLVQKVVEAFRLAHTADLQSKKSDNLKSQKQNAKAKAKTPSDNLKSKTKPGAPAPPKVKEKTLKSDNLKSLKQKTSKTSSEAKVSASAKTAKAKEIAIKPGPTKPISSALLSATKEKVVKPSKDKAPSKTIAPPTYKPVLVAPVPIPDFNEQLSEYSKRYPFLPANEVYLCFVPPNQNMLGSLRNGDMPAGLDKAGEKEFRKNHPLFLYLHRLIPSLPDRSSTQISTESLKSPQPSSQAKGKQPVTSKSDKVKSVSTTSPSQLVTSPAVAKPKALPPKKLTPDEWRSKILREVDSSQGAYFVMMSSAEQKILLSSPNPLVSLIEAWASDQ
jgi:hypothetical protein